MCRRQKPTGRTSHAATNDSPTICRVSDSNLGVVVRARAILTPEKALLEIVECLEGVLRNKWEFLRGSSACSCRYGQVRLLPFVDQTLKEADCESRVLGYLLSNSIAEPCQRPYYSVSKIASLARGLLSVVNTLHCLQEISQSYLRQCFTLALAI